jgi:outer membrane protein W
MRKTVLVAVSLLFVVAPAFAQEHANLPNTVSVFVSDLTVMESSSSGTNIDVAYGVAFDHMFSRRVSAELSVTRQRTRETVSTFAPSGPLYASFTNTLYPVDATVSYHFVNETRWKPYVGGGVRYVNGSVRSVSLFGSYRTSSHSIDPEVSGGVTFQFRPALGLRLDAKQTIGNGNPLIGGSALNVFIGLSFRF